MKNKITVSIAGQEYTMVAAEGEDYVRRVAAHVDSQMREVLSQGRLSQADGAVLAAMNIADQYFKEQEAAENLRRQIKEYLEEATKLKMEAGDLQAPEPQISAGEGFPAGDGGPSSLRTRRLRADLYGRCLMLELLAPAGSMEAVTAAVQNGADAV